MIAAYGRTQKTARDSGEKGGMTLVCDDEGKKGVASRAVHVRAHAKTEDETIVDRSRASLRIHPRQSFFFFRIRSISFLI